MSKTNGSKKCLWYSTRPEFACFVNVNEDYKIFTLLLVGCRLSRTLSDSLYISLTLSLSLTHSVSQSLIHSPHLIDEEYLRREERAGLDAGQCAGECVRGDEAFDLGEGEVLLQVVQLRVAACLCGGLGLGIGEWGWIWDGDRDGTEVRTG
jgi:hypothetical protein